MSVLPLLSKRLFLSVYENDKMTDGPDKWHTGDNGGHCQCVQGQDGAQWGHLGTW